MADESDIRWGLAQRFEFIEWRVYWTGAVNRKDLEDEFQISTPQASMDFRRYQEATSENIEYDASAKSYVRKEGFRPRFLNLSPEHYLLQLHALQSGAIRKRDTWFDKVPCVDATPNVVRGPQAYTLRAIVETIETQQAISINYRSLTRVGERTICPHALAHDGFRWHVRALSLERGEYRDYVLGRILSVSAPTACDADSSDDVAWRTIVRLNLTAHPQLNAAQKETIEQGYKFVDGELVVPMRLALAFYFVKRYNLDLRDGQISPERAQLFLKNYDELSVSLEAAKTESMKLVAARFKRSP